MTPTCLICGQPLEAVTLPHTPAWMCRSCFHSWTNAELTPTSRQAWRPQYRDFGSLTKQIQLAAIAEIGAQ